MQHIMYEAGKFISFYAPISVSLFKIFTIVLGLEYSLAFDPKDICNDVGADVWNYVPCDEYYKPDNCFNDKSAAITLDDFDRCGPSYMPITGRNYYLGASGRRETFNDNRKAIRKIKIIPKALRDVSNYNTKVNILGMKIDYPIGFSPVGLLKLAHSDGELALVSGLRNWNTILIVSSYATTSIEKISEEAKGSSLHLWMQTYIFKDIAITMDIVNRAEKNGFEALVITADTNASPTESCGARNGLELPPGVEVENIGPNYKTAIASNGTFNDITYIRSRTKLPIIVKGILSGSDAIKAIEAGASAILVSNHGGRQTDYSPATIDALPFVVDTVKKRYPHIEIYMDGGVRNGYDAYKALARGAKMVFLGRPSIWGVAVNGSNGINQVMDIITKDFQEVMRVSGHTDPTEITRDSLLPQLPTF